MKALVYHGPGRRGWDTVGDPTIIDPTDIVRIDTSTICSTDLHRVGLRTPDRRAARRVSERAVRGQLRLRGSG